MQAKMTAVEMLTAIKDDVEKRLSEVKSGNENYVLSSKRINKTINEIMYLQKQAKDDALAGEISPKQRAKEMREIEKKEVSKLIKDPAFKSFPAITKKYLNELNKELNPGVLGKIQGLLFSKPKTNAVRNWKDEYKQHQEESKQLNRPGKTNR